MTTPNTLHQSAERPLVASLTTALVVVIAVALALAIPGLLVAAPVLLVVAGGLLWATGHRQGPALVGAGVVLGVLIVVLTAGLGADVHDGGRPAAVVQPGGQP